MTGRTVPLCMLLNWVLLTALVSFVLPLTAYAGAMAVDPKRVVFDGRKRSAELLVINRGDRAATYKIYFQEMRMTNTGHLDVVDDPAEAEKTSSALLRYSPRRMTLGPGKMQSVRLLLRKPRDLEPGEYRSHLTIEELPDAMAGTDVEQLADNRGGVKVRMVARHSITIPVIARHGMLDASLELKALKYLPPDKKKPRSRIALNLHRQGTRSLYGSINVYHQPRQGERRLVGYIKGVAVYMPLQKRSIIVPLQEMSSERLRDGVLRVEFTETGRQGVKAAAELTIH